MSVRVALMVGVARAGGGAVRDSVAVGDRIRVTVGVRVEVADAAVVPAVGV